MKEFFAEYGETLITFVVCSVIISAFVTILLMVSEVI